MCNNFDEFEKAVDKNLVKFDCVREYLNDEGLEKLSAYRGISEFTPFVRTCKELKEWDEYESFIKKAEEKGGAYWNTVRLANKRLEQLAKDDK